MTPEFEQKLFNDFSMLFDNRHKSPLESCMALGIECGNGWHDLIRSVCYEIVQHEDNVKAKLIRENKNELGYNPVRFDQIKEKFGQLRIYYSGGDDYVRGVVGLATEMSCKICENCGNKGSQNKNGWIATLCDACRKS